MRALLLVALLAGTAAAEPTLELRVSDDRIIATVGGREPSRLILRSQGVGTDSVALRAFEHGPVAIAFVFPGTQLATEGFLEPLKAAVPRMRLDKLATGSEVAIYTYGVGANLQTPWRAASELEPGAFGSAADFATMYGSDRVAGLRRALQELSLRSGVRKLLIVIDDGTEPTTDMTESLETLAHSYRDIVITAVVIAPSAAEDGDVLDVLTPHVTRVPAVEDDIGAALQESLALATQRFELDYDASVFPADGRAHMFGVYEREHPVAFAELTLPTRAPATSSNTWRWLVLGGVVAAFCLVSFVMFRTPKRA